MRLLQDMKLSAKLNAIALILVVPIAWLLFLAITQVRSRLASTDLERVGLEYIRPLVKTVEYLREHELLSERVAAGVAGSTEERAGVQTRIDEQVRKILDADRLHGAELDFTDEGLSRRGRTGATAQAIERGWEDLKRRSATAKGEPLHKEYNALCETATKMVRHAFDTSTLVVDSDADAFYCAIVLSTQLAHVINNLGSAAVVTIQAIEKKTPTMEDRFAIAVAAGLVSSDSEIVLGRARALLGEDGRYHGESPSLQAKVPPAAKQFESDIKTFLDVVRMTNTTEKPTTTPESIVSTTQKARAAARALWDTLDAELMVLFTIRTADEKREAAVNLAITLIAVVSAFTLVFIVSRSLTRPLAECVGNLDSLAGGDLSVKFTEEGRGEVGLMTTSLGRAVHGMRSAILSISGEASRLKRASEDMASASHQMSSTAEETSNQAGVVSAAAEQVSKSIQSVSIATKEMNASIREVAKQATDAAKVAKTGVRVADATNATVSKLGESSAEIGKVIKVITSIAEQTNLLALNATIEAARVGEAGKGFAVVANEVKELARETARATEDISRKIEAIQTDSREVVAAINEIGAIINQINDIQGTIASAVEEQTLTTREIGRNVGEAASGAGEIARNIQGVADAAKNTSQGSHQTQDAARELARMAAALTELVARFKCD